MLILNLTVFQKKYFLPSFSSLLKVIFVCWYQWMVDVLVITGTVFWWSMLKQCWYCQSQLVDYYCCWELSVRADNTVTHPSTLHWSCSLPPDSLLYWTWTFHLPPTFSEDDILCIRCMTQSRCELSTMKQCWNWKILSWESLLTISRVSSNAIIIQIFWKSIILWGSFFILLKIYLILLKICLMIYMTTNE